MSARVSSVVLAAGMATRMGTVKQLLPFAGATILERVLATLRASEVSEIILVLGFAADEIRARVPLNDTKVVLNEDYREGMASSLRAGISAVDPANDAALIMLADQPLVQVTTINQLVIEFRARRPLIGIPTFNGQRGNPVLIGRSLFAELLQLSGDVGCRALFAAHAEDVTEIPVGDPGILIDFDIKEDLVMLPSAPSGSSG